jgi:hypothetical protein
MMSWSDICASAMAGLVARAPCHPLDTIKTVAAASESGLHSAAPAAVAREIFQREGIRGFYRGVGIASLGSAPGVACYISVYEYAKHTLPQVVGGTSDTPLVHLASGFCAETVSCIVWLPIDVTKERLQAQGPDVKDRYTNSVDAVIRVARLEGFRGLYKGYLLTLASFGPFSACYFASFEALKHSLFGLHAAQTPSGSQAFVCGATANAIACFLTQPLEVVKTRVQIQRAKLTASGTEFNQYSYHYAGMRDGITTIVRQDGVLGLWRGVLARVAYTAPNAALTFSLFAFFKKRLSPD